MSTPSSTPSSATQSIRGEAGYFPYLGQPGYAGLDGASILAGTIQGASAGTSHIVAGSIGSSDIDPTVLASAGAVVYTDTGTANGYVITPSPPITGYSKSQIFSFIASNANTAASTLNVNNNGAKPILLGGETLAANAIRQGQLVFVQYDGTNMQMISPRTNDSMGTLFVQTSSVTVANSTTPTTLGGTGNGSQTITNNSLRVGSRIKLAASGFFSTISTPNITFTAFLGSVTAAATAATATPSGASNVPWSVNLEIDVRTGGGTGTAICNGYMVLGSSLVPFTANTTTFAVDTTGTKIVDLQVTWGTASASNTITCTNFTVELLG